MKKFLLLSTIFMAGTAFAFGGIGIGGKSSSRRESGVDAIGIHIDTNGKKANVDIVDGDSPKECGFGWTLNTETNECECPEERQCGDTCCGEGNVCDKDLHKCCSLAYKWDGNVHEDLCCNTNESLGYANWAFEMTGNACCGADAVPYMPEMFLHDEIASLDGMMCCSGVILEVERNEEEEYVRRQCCPKGSTYVNDNYECCGDNTVAWEDAAGNQRCHPAGEGYYCRSFNPWVGKCNEYDFCPADKVIKQIENVSACCDENEEVYCSYGQIDHGIAKCVEAGCCPPGEECVGAYDQ